MLFVHPIIQLALIALSAYVFSLGIKRFRVLHLHQKAFFSWKEHADLGQIALFGLLAGLVGGVFISYLYWPGPFFSSLHGKVALAMTPFILLGALSGLYMNRRKQKRLLLPAIHGLSNLMVLLFSAVQLATGLAIVLKLIF